MNKNIVSILFVYLFAASGLLAQQAGTHPDKIGVDLDAPGAGDRARTFVDLAKTLRPWTTAEQNPAAVDEQGWPTCDAMTVLFDIRPFGTWKPPIDDPAKFQPDWSGTYKMTFNGQAVIGFLDEKGLQILQQKYDPEKNLTTADLVVSPGVGLLCISFKQTKRTAESPEGSGITHLSVLRPGVPEDTKAVFGDDFLKSLKPFAVLRFMDWLSTNHKPGFYGDPGHHALQWADRHVPEDATQGHYLNKYGVAWEYVVELANTVHKDIWINIPVAATDDYVKQLALLLKEKLFPECKIYIEHSNEVWNFGFPQYTYNKMAALDEVNQGKTTLNNDGAKDPEVLARRRHAKRLIEIGKTFREVFGAQGASRIRPVYASRISAPKPNYEEVLAWVEKTYGPPKNHFYALAGAAYFNTSKQAPNADINTLLKAMRDDSDKNLVARAVIQKLAAHYGVMHCQYEVGPDVGGGKPENVANRILSNRDPRMKEIILHDARDNWFPHGGDLYMYFSHCGASSRNGCWGLSEDIKNLNTPKWQAIYELTGAVPPR